MSRINYFQFRAAEQQARNDLKTWAKLTLIAAIENMPQDLPQDDE
jgi:hypothetical protein